MAHVEDLITIMEEMSNLERNIAALYAVLSRVAKPDVEFIFRKISMDSAVHSVSIRLMIPIIRNCVPRSIVDFESINTIRNNVYGASEGVKALLTFITESYRAGTLSLTDVVTTKLSELEHYEESAMNLYTFLLRSYLPLSSVRGDQYCRRMAKAVVRILRSIVNDEREHMGYLEVISTMTPTK